MTDKQLLTVREAGDALGLSRSTVYLLLGRGELTSVRIGTSRRIPPVALTEYVRRLSHAQGEHGSRAVDGGSAQSTDPLHPSPGSVAAPTVRARRPLRAGDGEH